MSLSFKSELPLAFLLLRRFTFRHWRQSWPSYLSLVAIVAVGVGAFLGIRQASRAATANFGLFNEAISGRSDFLITAAAGSLDETLLWDLGDLSAEPDWHLLPVIEGIANELDAANQPVRRLRLVGLDTIGLRNLPGIAKRDIEFEEETGEWFEDLGKDGAVWVTGSLAEVAGLDKDGKLRVVSGGRVVELTVIGILGDADSDLPDDLILADLPVAQQILGREGSLDRVEVLLADPEDRDDPDLLAAVEERLRAQLPDGLELQAAEDRVAQRASMTAAFRLNLLILSLIAILVGAYLILQALDAAVVRRRQELATLKSLGLHSKTIFIVIVLEAFVIGALGAVAGVGVGVLLASGAVHLLADTVNALYFETSVEAIRLQGTDWLLGIGLGTGFSLLAGFLPARDATETPPAQILSRGDWSPGFSWLRRPMAGIGFLVVAILAVFLPPQPLEGGGRMPLGGFIAATALILGTALLSGQVLVGLATLARRAAHGPTTRLALSRLADGSSRHRLAVAGLVVAVGMVTGMLQMVGSFRHTIISWFDVRFQADLYVSERGASGTSALRGLDPELIAELTKDDAIEVADTLYLAKVDGPVGVTSLAGANLVRWQEEALQIWLRPPGVITPEKDAEPALISETFGRRFDVLDGGVVILETPAGAKRITPVAVFADYGNEFGTAVVATSTWQEWMQSERPINTSLYLREGVDPNAVRDRLRLRFPGLDVRNEKELRTLALGIFDQTFRVTTALNGIGLAVAMAGLLLGLVAIFDESVTTWRTLVYLGYSRRRLLTTAAIEGGGIAAAAWVAGTVLGLAIGWLLIAVINVQSFGWTLLWRIPFATIFGFGLLLVAAGAVCGMVAAAWWIRREQPS